MPLSKASVAAVVLEHGRSRVREIAHGAGKFPQGKAIALALGIAWSLA
jgi:hypothetical protein